MAFHELGRAFHESLKMHLNDPQFSDLTIELIDREIKVHKLILCTQSDYFKSLFSGEWKDSKKSTLNFSNDDPEAISAMLQFMYQLTYDNDSKDPLLDIKVHQVADKYLVNGLKALVIYKVCLWDNAALETALPALVRQAYARIPAHDTELRLMIVRMVFDNIDKLSEDSSFQGLVRGGGEFVVDLMKESARYKKNTHDSRWGSWNPSKENEESWGPPAEDGGW